MVQIKRGTASMLVMVLALVVCAAAAPTRAAAAAAPSAPATLASTAAAAVRGTEECIAACRKCGFLCPTCTEVYTILVDPNNGTHWNYPYSCADAPCPNGCVEELGEAPPQQGIDIEGVRLAIAQNNLSSIGTLMEADSRIKLNAERKALQVVGCGDAIVAHLPLREDQLPALAVLAQ